MDDPTPLNPKLNTKWIKKEIKHLNVSKKEAKKLKAWYLSFIWAAISGTSAICYAQPFSLLKTRMHIVVPDNPSRNTTSGELQYIWGKHGYRGLYQGLSANLLRQLVYTTTRVGMFFWLIDLVKEENKVARVEFSDRFALGLFSGALAATISVPMEVAFVRMAADDRLPMKLRREYTNVCDALIKIFRCEGFGSLWVGTGPSIIKGMLQNAISLGIYTELKWKIRETNYFGNAQRNDWRITAIAAIISGAISAVVLAPFDLIKVRVQTAPFQNPKKYSTNMWKTIMKILRKEGFKPFYRGIIPTTLYLLPFTSSMFLCFEQMKILYDDELSIQVFNI